MGGSMKVTILFIFVLAMPFVFALQSSELAVYNTITLPSNTAQCGGGITCEADIIIPSSTGLPLIRGTNILFSLAYLNGTESPYTINYTLGHYENQTYTAQEPACTTTLEEGVNGTNGTNTIYCYNVNVTKTREILVWHGEKLVPGQNILHIWSDNKPDNVAVDWNFVIKNLTTAINGQTTTIDFDTRIKGWAVWGSIDYTWQNTSFTNRRNFTITDTGRVNTPVRVNISSFSSNTASAFAVYDQNNLSKPLNYLDANEHITSNIGNASYLLFTANSSELYFIYYNNNTPVSTAAAFLLWDRFINSSNNLPWTLPGGSWSYGSGYAQKTASPANSYYTIPNLYDYKDLGTFARVYAAVRGDDIRLTWRGTTNGNIANDGTVMVCDFGPTNYRCFGASSYSSTGGGGMSLSTWHNFTFRMGTSAAVLYEDQSSTATFTFTTPADAQLGSNANNYTGFGGQEQGTGRLDDYALWNWSLLGRVNFYHNLSTTYTIGASQERDLVANESVGRQAIISGLQSSTISSSYSYAADRQVYIRLANGSQYKGTFDIFVSAGSKRWAFNYDQNTTSNFLAFANITPVFYVWQRANMTSNAITNDVSAFINSTA
jgi:hypothetical protein